MYLTYSSTNCYYLLESNLERKFQDPLKMCHQVYLHSTYPEGYPTEIILKKSPYKIESYCCNNCYCEKLETD